MNKGLIAVVSALTGAAVGAAAVGKISTDANFRIRNTSDKHLGLFLLMNRWVQVKQEGKNLSSYFESNGYKKIAIYGMSYAGERLLEELKNTQTEVEYGIDRNADALYADITIVSPDEELKEVDAVVVTSIFYMDEVEKTLSEKLSCPILSLEDILYEV